MAKKRHNVLKVLRVVLAVIFCSLLTLMFLDFTGTLHRYLGWMAKVQLLPAILALNVGVVVVLLLLTLLFGRVYCSVVCPLGVMQDAVAHVSGKSRRHKYRPSAAHNVLRYTVLAVFVVLMIVGLQSITLIIAPYSAYGRIVQSLLAPLYALVNNGLAAVAERVGSYAFYETEVWLRSGLTLGIALVTLAVLVVISYRRGRLWCNTVCPVGGLLSLVSRYSLFAPVIDADKCTHCRACERSCKAECIDVDNAKVDTSRCVTCMNCLEQCRFSAIKYQWRYAKSSVPSTSADAQTDTSRRKFVTTAAALTLAGVASAQHKSTDGGLAYIEKKRVPRRAVPVKPAGSVSLRHFSDHCTACQLCVSACPSQVLRPSGNVLTLMQPEMGFEHGYCGEHCTRCSEVCPTGAIQPVKAEERELIQPGKAVWIRRNCVVLTDHVSCGNCAKHCPVHAIQMVDTPDGQVPAVDETRCIGCGKCEYLCPARPFSAIYVEGNETHQNI